MGEKRPRAREAGVVIGVMPPGRHNAITDVPGVAVGQVTLCSGHGGLVAGRGPVRTGVTAVLPHGGNLFRQKVPAAVHVINGFGKSTGFDQVRELGTIETPILLTNTLAVGRVWDAVVSHMIAANPDIGVGSAGTVNPVVGECNDGFLNDIQGRHVGEQHVLAAIRSAAAGPVAEGACGAGTGMSCFGFKGGIGTASRLLPAAMEGYTVGVLVLANYGRREDLVIDGVPVGRELKEWPGDQAMPGDGAGQAAGQTPAVPGAATGPDQFALDVGSVMVVLGTDAPLDARQLGRLARRAGLGLARTGSIAGHGSGDFVIAFATTAGPPPLDDAAATYRATRLAEKGGIFGALFKATIEATEEAVINALFAAPTTEGRDGHVRPGLPIPLVREILGRHGRLSQ